MEFARLDPGLWEMANSVLLNDNSPCVAAQSIFATFKSIFTISDQHLLVNFWH
jgi:hypothetical protein